MSKESTRWNPSHWTGHKVRLFTNRVLRCAWRELELMVGPSQGALALAELRADLSSESSRVQLEQRGIKLLGGT